jgi:hypothetical protein
MSEVRRKGREESAGADGRAAKEKQPPLTGRERRDVKGGAYGLPLFSIYPSYCMEHAVFARP